MNNRAHQTAKRLWWWAQCGDRKVKHESYESAKDHVLKLAEETQSWYEIYVCPYCGFWHVGRMRLKGSR